MIRLIDVLVLQFIRDIIVGLVRKIRGQIDLSEKKNTINSLF